MAESLEQLAHWSEEQWARPVAVPEILERAPGLSLPDAYRVQQLRMERHVAAGDRIIGYKAALTSKPMQQAAGIEEPVLGTLLASRQYPDEQPVPLQGFFHTRVEPEVGVLLKSDLRGPGVTPLQALPAIGGYLPAIEVGDIRTGDNARSLQQTIACNTFNGGYVFGGPIHDPAGIDLRLEEMVLSLNGEVQGSATAVEVLGDAILSVCFMANKLAEAGLSLQAGMVLLTGSIVRSVAVQPGDAIRVAFTRLGSLHVRFGG
jgi:2-keto-4-pentenoate hydratase